MSASPTWLLASDLDGTLIGDPAALRTLNAALLAARPMVAIAYVTGRTLASALDLLAEADLVPPDVIIASVGTAIHYAPDWRLDAGWERRIAPDWCADRVDAVAGFFPELRRQPPHAQGPHKRCFLVDEADAGSAVPALRRALRQQRVRAQVVFSSGRDVDVIPFRAGKGQATLYAAARLGISPDRVVACGDSGNDVDLLAMGGRAALVGNALPELRRFAPPGAYFATATYAAGVHEALAAFGLLLPAD